MPGRNRLSESASPYLLQHKDNPVWWYSWGEEAFKAAKEEDKPIFLSIGYSTCYWCHVMEKDSFEQDDVARALNQDFVSIKVDREERPDVDQIYMDAVVGLTGHGGWPMSVFLTPDGKPFWAGTFFYRPQFLRILAALAEAWKKDREKVTLSANELTSFIQERASKDFGIAAIAFDESLEQQVLNEFTQSFDREHGGFGNAPKFPPSEQISLLLHLLWQHRGDNRMQGVEAMIRTTLDCMAKRGLFDQIGGGFHRYSTDAAWVVPHFEKMLYDNALLARTYTEAYQVLGDENYRQAAIDTLSYVRRDLKGPSGFFAAEDAGEVGKEGEFYVWTLDQLAQALTPEELSVLRKHADFPDTGNFEHGSIILTLRDLSSRLDPWIRDVFAKLHAIRAARPRPHRDEKVLAGWNGLLLSAFAKAGVAFQAPEWLEEGRLIIEMVRTKLWDGRSLTRSLFESSAQHRGTLEDYVYLIQGLLDYYHATFDSAAFSFAVDLQNVMDKELWDELGGGYFFSSSPELIVRKKEFVDGALPSPNGVALLNLLRLSRYGVDGAVSAKAQRIVAAVAPLVRRVPSAFSSTIRAMAFAATPDTELAVVWPTGAKPAPALLRLQTTFAPALIVAGGEEGASIPPILESRAASGKETYYLCQNHSCEAPTTKASDVLERLKERGILSPTYGG